MFAEASAGVGRPVAFMTDAVADARTRRRL
jgi:hypothetical protein